MRHGLREMGPVRTAARCLRLNQRDGFDCPAAPGPIPTSTAHHAEFCENGAKAVAEEATLRASTPEFFAQHSVEQLASSVRLLDRQAGPAHRTRWTWRPGATHYRPIGWDDAFALIAPTLRGARARPTRRSSTPRGRTSNEAAFVYQLFVRALRDQQPARLLQHVPRVQRRRADADDRRSARAASRSTTSSTPT